MESPLLCPFGASVGMTTETPTGGPGTPNSSHHPRRPEQSDAAPRDLPDGVQKSRGECDSPRHCPRRGARTDPPLPGLGDSSTPGPRPSGRNDDGGVRLADPTASTVHQHLRRPEQSDAVPRDLPKERRNGGLQQRRPHPLSQAIRPPPRSPDRPSSASSGRTLPLRAGALRSPATYPLWGMPPTL